MNTTFGGRSPSAGACGPCAQATARLSSTGGICARAIIERIVVRFAAASPAPAASTSTDAPSHFQRRFIVASRPYIDTNRATTSVGGQPLACNP